MRTRFTLTSLAALTALLYGCGGSGSGSNTPPQLSCADITTEAMAVSGLVVTNAVAHAADSPTEPAYCLVEGHLHERKSEVDNQQYAIGFELRLPTDWNGRFFFQGGGGTDGAVNPAVGTLPGEGQVTNALAEGYAVASTDGGHKTINDGTSAGGALFGVDPQARIDYGYNAVGEVTKVAQNLILRHYGSEAERSYFVGCSNGGRQAMVAASRFADLYDGVIAGNPGFNLPKAGIQHAWDNQQFAKAAPRDPSSNRPIIKDSFTRSDMSLVANKVLGVCDELDGLKDGLIMNSSACQAAFDPVDQLTCKPGEQDGVDCFSNATKIDALKQIFGGPKNSQGQSLYASWPWDAGIASTDWRIWKLELFPGPDPTIPTSLIATMGGAALPYIFMTPPVQVPGVGHGLIDYLLGYNFDTDAPGIYKKDAVYTESSMEFMTPPHPTDLSRFRDRGGKMIVHHGNSDPVFSVHDTIQWYENLKNADSKTDDYVRLYTVPGQAHCGGGPSTSQFDLLNVLVDWVENDKAPGYIVAKASPQSTLTGVESRPLCPYPQYAKYDGSGDPKVASSFQCVTS